MIPDIPTPGEERVERWARDICRADGVDPDLGAEGSHWRLWHDYRDHARAAIALADREASLVSGLKLAVSLAIGASTRRIPANDGTVIVLPGDVSRVVDALRDALSRVEAGEVPDDREAAGRVEAPIGYAMFEAVIGESYKPHVWGFHEALHYSRVRQALAIADQRTPEVADVIRALIRQQGIVDNRAQHAWEAAQRAEDALAEAGRAVPEGHWLAPDTLTPEMIAAGEREWDGRMSARLTGLWEAWKTAAPQPSEPGVTP